MVEVDNIAVLFTSNSADRLHRDWKGSEALLLTQDQALKDDTTALIITGFARLALGYQDSTGHSILLVDPSMQDKSKYTRERMLRVLWYMIHAALETESTQRFGMVAFPNHARFSQFDRHHDARHDHR